MFRNALKTPVMKKVYCLLLLLITILSACKKGEDTLPMPNITGLWTFVAARGGVDNGYVPIPAIVVAYTFNADGTYNISPYQRTGTYSIGDIKSVFSNTMQPYITFSNTADIPGLITVKNDTLIIMDNHSIPNSYIYV